MPVKNPPARRPASKPKPKPHVEHISTARKGAKRNAKDSTVAKLKQRGMSDAQAEAFAKNARSISEKRTVTRPKTTARKGAKRGK
jgi:hypothetical protein